MRSVFAMGYPKGFAGSIPGRNSIAVFTGLIEEVGQMLWIRATERGTELQIAAPRLAELVSPGESIAVNGCCLTLTAQRSGHLLFDLLNETLERTNLKTVHRDGALNLERALTADGRFGGHFVQGHVDCVARIISHEQTGNGFRLEVSLPHEFAHYIAYKGSIAIDGISLTVAEVLAESFAVWIIPHTQRATNMGTAKSGDVVNLEFDILAKYIERQLPRYLPQS